MLGLNDCYVQNADFLGWAVKNLESGDVSFDAVAGNPPFIRYQYLPSDFQDHSSAIFEKLFRSSLLFPILLRTLQ